ncbi:hypothetical protein JW960_07575 [candidate division KSB1 bacterium]|nr:hypothetical protein [candidate division KSB1 bacterium]
MINRLPKNNLNYLVFPGLPLLTAILLVFQLTCTTENPTEIYRNRRPETHLFLYPGTSGLDTTLSTQVLHWWGDDPDGQVVGYYYKWDFYQEQSPDSFRWTTSEHDTFLLPIRQKFDDFRFYVKAVDNSARWNYPSMLKSNYDNEFFQDVGSQKGRYDDGDMLAHIGDHPGIQTPLDAALTELDETDIYRMPPTDTLGAVDPSPAELTFPIRNSKPSVHFVYNSNPPDSIYAETFTTRTFFWTANDSDGIETITNFYYYLADEFEAPPASVDNWDGKLPGNQKSITLRDVTPGNHVFYLSVEDIAGELGSAIRYPAEKGQWKVRAPLGDILLIDDYEPQYDFNLWTTTFYNNVLDTLSGVNGNYSIWNIEERVPYAVIDIFETLNFFNKVIWYTDSDPHFQTTASSIYRYIAQGKKILISSVSPTQYIDGVDSLYMFLKSDSLKLLNGVDGVDIGRASKNSYALSQLPELFPDLQLAYYISWIDALIPSENVDPLYVLDRPPRPATIAPIVGIKYPKGPSVQFIYLNFPLHYMFDIENVDRPENTAAVDVLRKILVD